MHDAASDGHLGLEIRVGGRKTDTVFGFDGVQGVALADAEFGEEFLGQDDADRVADLGEFEDGHDGGFVTKEVII